MIFEEKGQVLQAGRYMEGGAEEEADVLCNSPTTVRNGKEGRRLGKGWDAPPMQRSPTAVQYGSVPL